MNERSRRSVQWKEISPRQCRPMDLSFSLKANVVTRPDGETAAHVRKRKDTMRTESNTQRESVRVSSQR